MKLSPMFVPLVFVALSALFATVAQADEARTIARGADSRLNAPAATPTSEATPAAVIAPPAATPAAIIAPPARPPSRFSYSLSTSGSFPSGNLGYNVTALRGIIQGGLGYQIDPLTKVQADAFQIPAAIIGLNGSAPLYISGNSTAVGSVKLPPTNPSSIYKIASVTLQRTFFIDHHPIIVSPGYISSFFEYDDALTIENPSRRQPENVKLRSFQDKFVAVTVPIILRRDFIALATASAQWLVAPHGLNQTNHPQLQFVGYMEYFANQHTSFFFQPSRFLNYLPSDPYPEYSFVPIYGINYRFTKQFWAQAELLTLSPANYPLNGVSGVTCATAACASVAPNIGSVKATTISISIGIGKPFVVPI